MHCTYPRIATNSAGKKFQPQTRVLPGQIHCLLTLRFSSLTDKMHIPEFFCDIQTCTYQRLLPRSMCRSYSQQGVDIPPFSWDAHLPRLRVLSHYWPKWKRSSISSTFAHFVERPLNCIAVKKGVLTSSVPSYERPKGCLLRSITQGKNWTISLTLLSGEPTHCPWLVRLPAFQGWLIESVISRKMFGRGELRIKAGEWNQNLYRVQVLAQTIANEGQGQALSDVPTTDVISMACTIRRNIGGTRWPFTWQDTPLHRLSRRQVYPLNGESYARTQPENMAVSPESTLDMHSAAYHDAIYP